MVLYFLIEQKITVKIIIAPDKFKGSLNCFEVCEAIEIGLKQIGISSGIYSFPLADGGDGFSAVMQYYLHTTTINCATIDPLFRSMEGHYQWSPNTRTAIIELAVASGIALVKESELNPMLTTTYGTGLLIKDAIEKGAEKIILGIGGSATNDAGMGICAALGFTFFDQDHNSIPFPTGVHLSKIKKIMPPAGLPSVEWKICCDVNNPFCGPNGAAYIYGPQKGADKNQVEQLDKGLSDLALVMKNVTGKDVTKVPGAGAAGGVAGGLMALLNATLVSGIDMVLETSGIEKNLEGANLILTGEGKLDHQSLQGKVVGTVADLSKKNNIPCIAFCGRLALSKAEIKEAGLTSAFSIAATDTSLVDSIKNAKLYLQQKVATILYPILKDV